MRCHERRLATHALARGTKRREGDMSTHRMSLGGRAVALAFTIVASVTMPARTLNAAPSRVDRTTPDVRLTERDVAASNEKVKMAFADLASLWRGRFGEVGGRFAVPRLLRYRGAARSACGVMQPHNAAYCPSENAIYYDEVFVAAQAK